MTDCKDPGSDSWCCSDGGKSCDCSKGNVTFPGARSLVSTIPYPKSSATSSSEANLLQAQDLSFDLLRLTSRNDSFVNIKRQNLLIFLLWVCLFRFLFGDFLFTPVGFSGAIIDRDDLIRHASYDGRVYTKIK